MNRVFAVLMLAAVAIPCFADYGSYVTALGPVAYYRFQDASSAGGAVMADTMGNLSGTYQGAGCTILPSGPAGIMGKALALSQSGGNSFGQVPAYVGSGSAPWGTVPTYKNYGMPGYEPGTPNNAFDPALPHWPEENKARTIVSWFKYDGTANKSTIFSYGARYSQQNGFIARMNTNGSLVFGQADSFEFNSGALWGLADNQWHLFAMTVTPTGLVDTSDKSDSGDTHWTGPGNIELFIDGISMGVKPGANGRVLTTNGWSTSITPDGRWAYLGRDELYNWTSNCLSGALAEFAVFNKVLGAAEIANLYNMGSVLAGDADGDAKVDFADYLILEASFGGAPGGAGSDADFDNNGVVDFADYLILEAAFGAGVTVPEPVTLALLALGGLALIRRR